MDPSQRTEFLPVTTLFFRKFCFSLRINISILQLKFLGVMLDKRISWIDHVRTVENKIVKNIGLLYRVSQFLNEDSLKTVYFSYIHSYLNYANIAWASKYAASTRWSSPCRGEEAYPPRSSRVRQRGELN